MMQQQESMSQSQPQSLFVNELAEGEEMLWFGSPQPGSRASGGPGIVFRILGTVFGLIGFSLLLVSILFTLLQPFGGSTIIFTVFFSIGLPFFIIGVVFTILGFVLKPALKSVYYAITDQRIIILHPGHNLRVESYGKEEIGRLLRTEHPDGSGDLEFTRQPTSSNYVAYSNYGNYNTGYQGNAGTSYPSTGRFIGVPNIRSVEQLIRRTFKSS